MANPKIRTVTLDELKALKEVKSCVKFDFVKVDKILELSMPV